MYLQEETMRLRISYIILFYMKRLKYYKCNGYTFTFLTCRIKVYNYCVNITSTVAINKHSDRIQPTVVDEVFPWGKLQNILCLLSQILPLVLRSFMYSLWYWLSISLSLKMVTFVCFPCIYAWIFIVVNFSLLCSLIPIVRIWWTSGVYWCLVGGCCQ